jgi:hypothetical protein
MRGTDYKKQIARAAVRIKEREKHDEESMLKHFGNRCPAREVSIVDRILNHAEVFGRFRPDSLTYFAGIPENVAAAHCSNLVKLGKLERLPDFTAAWYRKAANA